MSHTKHSHTPGPWDNMADGSSVKAFNSGVTVCETECGSQVASYEERQANARLIAAAPELLEALERQTKIADIFLTALSAYDGGVAKGVDAMRQAGFDAPLEEYKKAKAAIARARGEKEGA